MPELVVLIPTLNRPHALATVAQAFAETTSDYRLLFIVDPDDRESKKAAEMVGDVLVAKRTGYAAKVNQGIKASTEPLILFAADDVKPHSGWLETAKSYMTDEIGMVSPNDLGNSDVMRGRFATFPLIARWYAELDDEFYHEGYRHNCCDVEASGKAQKRGAFVYAPDAIMEHLHPIWGKNAPGIDGIDQTYKDWALDPEGIAADNALLNERRALWA